MEKTLKDVSTEQLKALAYDMLATIEDARSKLKIINAEISGRISKEEVKQVEETKSAEEVVDIKEETTKQK